MHLGKLFCGTHCRSRIFFNNMKTTRLEKDGFQLQEVAQGDLLIYFSADCHRVDSFNTELLRLRRLGRRRKARHNSDKTNSSFPYQSMLCLAEPLPTCGKPAEYRTRKVPIAPVVRLRTRGKYKNCLLVPTRILEQALDRSYDGIDRKHGLYHVIRFPTPPTLAREMPW